MSAGEKRPYAQVRRIAEQLMERLRPFCSRIELAGSLRRERPFIGDIEIVAVPLPVQASFDGTVQRPYLLDEWKAQQAAIQVIRDGARLQSWQFATTGGSVYKVDLFLQPDPATWGQNFMIRTGSADFAKWMVTPASYGGAVPVDDQKRPLFQSVAARWRAQDGTLLDTPEESDVFGLLGLDWIPPQQREAGLWKR